MSARSDEQRLPSWSGCYAECAPAAPSHFCMVEDADHQPVPPFAGEAIWDFFQHVP